MKKWRATGHAIYVKGQRAVLRNSSSSEDDEVEMQMRGSVVRRVGLGAVLLLGFESPNTPAPPSAFGPPPSSDMTRIWAWRDVEAAADARSPVAGRRSGAIVGTALRRQYDDGGHEDRVRELQPVMQVAYLNDRDKRVVHRPVRQITPEAWAVQGFNERASRRLARHAKEPDWRGGYAAFVHDLLERPSRGAEPGP